MYQKKMASALACLFVSSLASSCLAQGGTATTPATTPPVEVDFVKPANFKYGEWHSSIIGGGGYVQNIIPCPSNPKRFYTNVDVAGMSRSDDGGKTWRMLHGNLPGLSGNNSVRGLIVDPRDDKKIMVATGGRWAKRGIYVSDDAGETFTQTLTAHYDGNGAMRAAGFIIARDPQNPDVVVTSAINDGVFISRDNGKTWTPSAENVKGLFPADIRFDRTNSQRLWLCAGSTKMDNTQFVGGFYRSDDGGATWTKLLDAPPQEIIQDPKDASTIFGIFKSEIIRKSTDGGATWVDFSDGLQIKPLEPGKWKESIDKTAYNALGAGPDFILTCNTRDADIYKLQSGATKWEKVERNAPEVGDWFHKGGWAFGGAAGSLTVDPHDPKHWFITDFFAIYQSYDAGKNWRLTVDGLETTVAHCTLQDPTDAGIMHIGLADVGNFNSVDGGTRFRQAKVPNDGEVKDADAGGGNMKCMALNPKLPNRIYGVANRNWFVLWEANQVYISIDRGQTWTRSPMVGLPTKVVCSTIVVDPNDPYTVYITAGGQIKENGGGVYKSTAGGARWKWIGDGLPVGSWYFANDIWAHGRQLAIQSDGSMLALCKQGNMVYRFDPATQKWSRANTKNNGQAWSVAADPLKPGRFFLGARTDGAYRSDDSGVTWKKVYNKSVSFIETDTAVAGRVAGGTLDGIVLSTDGGETWKELDKKLPAREDGIPGFAGERLFVASGGSGVFWIPLSPAGEKTVPAKALVTAPAPIKGALPELVNLNGDAEDATIGWKVEATAGTLNLTRDTAMKQGDTGGALQISTGGSAATGTISQEWKPTIWNFKISGGTRAKGSFEKIQVVLQPFDAADQPLAPIVLRDQKANNAWWDGFGRTIALPSNVERVRLETNIQGNGTIWLENFKIALPQPLYPQ